MTGADVRWKQCLTSYVRAIALLQDALKAGVEPLNSLEKDGTVQRFGITLELGWSVIRDYLQASGIEFPLVTPRSVIKAGFGACLLPDAHVWEDMLQWRSWLVHDYDETLLNDGVELIHVRFLPALESLAAVFEELEDRG